MGNLDDLRGADGLCVIRSCCVRSGTKAEQFALSEDRRRLFKIAEKNGLESSEVVDVVKNVGKFTNVGVAETTFDKIKDMTPKDNRLIMALEWEPNSYHAVYLQYHRLDWTKSGVTDTYVQEKYNWPMPMDLRTYLEQWGKIRGVKPENIDPKSVKVCVF